MAKLPLKSVGQCLLIGTFVKIQSYEKRIILPHSRTKQSNNKAYKICGIQLFCVSLENSFKSKVAKKIN